MQFSRKLFAEALAYAYVSQPAQFQFWRRLQPHYKKSTDFDKKILGDFSESFFCENYFLRLICKPLYFAYLHFCKKWGGPIFQTSLFFARLVGRCIGAIVFLPQAQHRKTFAPLRDSAFGVPLAGEAVAARSGFFHVLLSPFSSPRRIILFSSPDSLKFK